MNIDELKCKHEADLQKLMEQDELFQRLLKYMKSQVHNRNISISVVDIAIRYQFPYSLSFSGKADQFLPPHLIEQLQYREGKWSTHIPISWFQAKAYLYRVRQVLLLEFNPRVREIGKIVYEYDKELKNEAVQTI